MKKYMWSYVLLILIAITTLLVYSYSVYNIPFVNEKGHIEKGFNKIFGLIGLAQLIMYFILTTSSYLHPIDNKTNLYWIICISTSLILNCLITFLLIYLISINYYLVVIGITYLVLIFAFTITSSSEMEPPSLGLTLILWNNYEAYHKYLSRIEEIKLKIKQII